MLKFQLREECQQRGERECDGAWSSLSLPPPGCVTMSQSYNLSGPQLYHLILSHGRSQQFILPGWGAKEKGKMESKDPRDRLPSSGREEARCGERGAWGRGKGLGWRTGREVVGWDAASLFQRWLEMALFRGRKPA